MLSSELFPTETDFIPDDELLHDQQAQIQLFAYAMEAFQEPNLPYHNWEWHIKTSYQEAHRLFNEYQEKKAPEQPDADLLVIAFAVIGHDSGYSHFKTADELKVVRGFDSKEQYSCHITEINMLSLDFGPDIIDKVKTCIMATKLGEDCPSIEAVITRRSDLFNIAGQDYGVFKEATKNFRLEVETWNNNGKPISIADFVRSSWPILNEYTRNDIKLYPSDKHPLGTSRFLASFYLNMNRLMIECGVAVSEEVVTFIKRLIHRTDSEVS